MDSQKIQDYISLSEASKLSGYSQDYLGFLCRSGKLSGMKLGRNWVVLRSSVDQFVAGESEVQGDLESAKSEEGIKIPVRIEAADVESTVTQLVYEATPKTFVTESESVQVVNPVAFEDWQVEGRFNANLVIEDEQKDEVLEDYSFVPVVAEDGVVVEAVKEDAVMETGAKNKVQGWGWAVFAIGCFALAVLMSAMNFGPLLQWWIGTLGDTSFKTAVTRSTARIPRIVESVISPRGQTEKNQEVASSNTQGEVLAAKTTKNSLPVTKVVTVEPDERLLNKIIEQQLANLASIGLLKGQKGDPGPAGPPGPSNSFGPSYTGGGAGYAPAPMQYYVPQNPSPSNNGGSLFSATDISAQRLTGDTLLVTGNATVQGNLSVTGSISGTYNPGLTTGSVLFQGANGIAEDTNIFWDDTANALGVGTNTPEASAVLELESTTKGFLAPRMTTAERDAITSPATGLLIYNTSTDQFNVYSSGAWATISGGGGGGSSVWSDLTNPTAGLALSMAEYSSSFGWNTGATAASFDGFVLNLTNDATTDANTQRLLVVQNVNSTGSTDTERLMVLNNADTDEQVVTALEIASAAGGIATALDVSDSDITTAIAIGANDVTVGGATISSTEFARLDGKDAALLDTNDAVTTAITGTGALDSGSITSNFGAIDVGSDAITTSGTVSAGTLSINGDSFTDLAGTGLSISGGVLQTTLGASVDLGAEVTGTLPVGNGGTGATSLNDLITLGTHTTGNYVATISNGSGISGSSATEGGTPTISLGPLTGDWNQSGAFDVTLNNASSELKILESVGGAFYGIFDVTDLSGSDKTYTFPNASGTVITSGNISDITGLTDAQVSDTLTASNFVGSGSSTNAVDLATAEVSGTLAVDNGGTGATTFATNGILFGNGTGAVQVTSAAANSVLATNGSNVPALTQTLPTAVQGNITSLGTIASGVWQGTAIVDTYVADILTISSSGSVDWAALTNYPSACGAGSAITALGDTPTCTAFNADSSITLQDAYDATSGNIITTTNNRDIDIVLANSTTDSNLDIQIASDSTSTVSISRVAGSGTANPSQLLVIEDLDADLTIADAVVIRTAGILTDAIDVSDAEIVNAINVGANNIVGTTGNIDLSNFDVTGSSGNIVTAGTLAVNGDSITSDGATLAINAGGTVDVQDTLNTDNVTTDTGGVSIAAGQSYTGGGAVTLSSANASNLTINSGTTGTLAIGDDASNETINIATGAAVKTLNLGSTNSTSTTTVQSGSGNITLQAAGSGTSGTVSIGESGTTPDILVVGTKTSAGNPSVSDGGVYYNSNSGKFYIAEGGSWKEICNKTDAACGAGSGSAWSALTNASGNLSLANAEYTTTISFDTAATANAKDFFNLVVTNDAGTDATAQQVLTVVNADAAGSTSTESLVVLDNQDTNEAVDAALKVISAAGAITTALDVSDSDIVTALNAGGNDLSGSAWSITGSSGAASFVGVNSGSGLLQGTGGLTLTGDATFTLGAGQNLAIDAATTDHTDITGVIDLDVDSSTNAVSGINVDVENNSTATAGTTTVFGIVVNPNITAAGAGGIHEVIGTYIQAASGTAGAGTQNVYGVRIANQGAATNEETTYGLYVDSQSGGGTASYAAVFAGGNVGIGTTTPANLLQLVGGDLGVSTDGSDTSTPRVMGMTDLTTGEAARIQFGDALNSFQTAHGNRMQIQGFWGLELSGSRQSVTPMSFTGGGASDPSVTVIGGVNTVPVLRVQGVASQSGDLLQVQNSSGTNYVVIDASGDVGIGTAATSIEALLEVQGAEGADAVIALDADDGDDNADTWFIESEAADNDLSIVNHTTEVLNLTSGGNLQIDGNLTISGTAGGGTQCLQVSNTGVVSGTGSSCGGASSLQAAYTGGATIETASNTPVLITETTAASNTGDLLQLTQNAATGGTTAGDALQITLDSVDSNGNTGNGIRMVIDQSQNTGNAILIEDDAAVSLFQLDENGGLTLGAASAQTTAITITDTDYTNALSIGDNNITGTTANIDLTNFDVVGSTGAVTAAGLITGTAGATISGATTSINASSNFNTNINTGTSTGAVSIGNNSAGAISLAGSTLSLTSNGAGNDITLNSADTIELQDNTNVTGSLDVTGTIQAGSGNITLTDATGNIQAGSYAAASIDGDDIASSLAGAGLVLTAGSPDVLDIGAGNGITVNANDVALNLNYNPTWTADHTWTLSAAEDLAVTHDLAGSVSVFNITATPSGSAGTTNGISISQADSANSNGLDRGILIDNVDTNLAITDGIKFTNTGGGGYTNFLETPSIDISGAGAITGATGYNGLVITPNTGVVTTGTWNGTAVTDTYVADALTISSSGTVDWTALSNYPAACSAGSAVSTLADSPTCTSFNTDTTITLQDAYNATSGNTITTTTGRNISFVLGEVASPTSLTLENQDTAGTSAQRIFSSIASGTLTNGLLIEQTGAGTMTNALQIAETSGTITDGILITGTLGNILNSPTIDITGAGAITGATGVSTTTVTASSAIAANGGITFDASTDTVGAFTAAGTIDMNANLIVNIGNSGTDFTSGGGLTVAGTLDSNGDVSIADTNIALDGASSTLTATGALTLTPGGAMVLGATGQAATLQGTTTTITSNGAGNDITLTAADDILQNPTDDVLTTLAAAGNVNIDAATTASTGTAQGVFDINVNTVTSDNRGFQIDYVLQDASGNATVYGQRTNLTVDTDAAQTHTAYGQYINVANNDASSTAYGLYVDAGTGAGTEYAAVFMNGNVGIGTATPSNAALQIVKTTEQLRLAYDATNYAPVTVSSNGYLTIDAAGNSPGINLDERVDFAGNVGVEVSGAQLTLASGFTTLLLANTGSIGLGDATPTEGKVVVGQTDVANDEALYINTEESTTSQTVFAIETDAGTADSVKFSVAANGNFTTSGTGYIQKADDPGIVFQSTAAAGDTDFWIGALSDGGTDDDVFAIGRDTAIGTNTNFVIDHNGWIGVNVVDPQSFVHIQQSGDSTNTSAPVMFDINSVGAAGELTASSGTQTFARIAPVINQSSSAGYTALLINSTQTGTGSGSKLLQDWQVGGVSVAKIDSTGALTVSSCTGCGGGASSLQAAYTGGATIETASNTPVLITETTAASNTGDLLQLTQNAATGGTTAGDALQITLDSVDSNGNTGNGIRMVIDQSQNTGNAILIEDDAAVSLFQLDENGGLTLGAASAQTTAITITDTDYTNSLSIGDNNITGTTYTLSGTTAAISFTDFGVDSDGKVSLSPDAAGDAFSISTAAADIQGIVIDASTNDSTQTAGMIQVTADTVTNNAILGLSLTGNVRDAAGNLTAIYGNKTLVTVDSDAGQTHTVYGEHITVDNDDASSTVYGLYVDADGDGGGTGTEYSAVFLDGNLGVGDTTPDAILEVNAASGTMLRLETPNGGGSVMQIYRDDGSSDANNTSMIDFGTVNDGNYWNIGVDVDYSGGGASDFEFQGGGTTHTLMQSDGDIGFGDLTPTEGQIVIGTTDAANKVSLYINTEESTTTQNVFVIESDTSNGSGADTAKFKITADGSTYNDPGTFTTPADIAEMYYAVNDLEAGDVVVPHPVSNTPDGITYGMRKFDPTLDIEPVGVVSTKPAQTLGYNWHRPEIIEMQKPIALAGRVPVKISLENGSVQNGDFLAPSKTKPGFAAKAIESGIVIGRALESIVTSTGEIDKIEMFISVHDWQPRVSDLVQLSGSPLYENSDMTLLNLGSASAIESLVVTDTLYVQEDLHVKGIIYAAEVRTDKLTTKELCLEEVCITKDKLQQLINLLDQPVPAPASSSGGGQGGEVAGESDGALAGDSEGEPETVQPEQVESAPEVVEPETSSESQPPEEVSEGGEVQASSELDGG